MAQNITWPGSGSQASGSTPFSFYDSDALFQSDAPRFADWAARRLGYPVVDVEMQDLQFYACFEEAISEYSAQVNQFNIINNINLLTGTPLSGSQNLSGTNIQGSGIAQVVKLSSDYGVETGAGGQVSWKRGYVNVLTGEQMYDLTAWSAVSESGAPIEMKRLYHQETPAITRYFDPYALTGMGTYNMINEFGFQNYSPGFSTFMLYPVFADLLRLQAIEFNEQVRKSQYGFTLINNILTISPIPAFDTKLYFEYIVISDRDSQLYDNRQTNVISDYSNVPYSNIEYSKINSVGLQWIKKYGFALVKELLGAIREKYSNVPINDGEVSLDGAALRSEAQIEKDSLMEQLRTTLEETSRKAQMESRSQQADQHQQMLTKIPMPIYVR